MKVGIFETEHFEVAYTVVKLFDTSENEITIYTDPPTHKHLKDLFGTVASRYHWVVLYKSPTRLHFFWQLYIHLQKQQPDLLYFNTISSNHMLYALIIRFLRSSRVVLTVHDINCFFHSSPSLNIRRMVHHIGKRLLIRWVKEFNVISDTMVPYIAQQSQNHTHIHNVPGAVFDGKQLAASDSQYIRLVVPGAIDKKRRDYAQLWILLQEAERKQFPLHLTILGGYSDDYGKKIINEADHFPSYYTRIQFYRTHLVDQGEFDRQLSQAHFLFIPSVVQTVICHNIPEVYGLTKSSGNVFDAIKHARPLIIPESLQVPASLASSCITYREVVDIIPFLQQLREMPQRYVALQQNALHNSNEFTLEKVRARNPTLFGLPTAPQ